MRKGEIIRVSSKGQIVLPKRFRDDMRIQEGDYVTLYEVGDGLLIMEKTKASPLEAITADLRAEVQKRGFTPEDLAREIKKLRKERRSDAS